MASWPTRLLPILVAGLGWLAASGASGDEYPLARADALNGRGGQLYAEGRYAEAMPLALEALAIRETMLGPEHPAVAQSLTNLAMLYSSQGRHAEAEPLYERGLSIWEKALGPDHPNVADGLNGLAELYDAQARYVEAEPLLKRSLAIRETTLGAEHPHVAQSLSNLGVLYRDQGRHADAELLLRRSLAIREKALGAEHPYVSASLSNLAGLYRAQGRLAEAEPLYARSLAIQETTLGAGHPQIATILNDLAGLYDSQGRHADAEALYRRSLSIWEKALGSEHPYIATGLNNLAGLYGGQGRHTEAEPLLKRSLEIGERTLGAEHPYVAQGLNNLARLYGALGRHADAVAVSRRAVGILARRFADASDDPAGGTGAERRTKRLYFVENVARVHTVDGDGAAAETFRVAQLAGASGAARGIVSMAARIAGGADSPLAAVVRERQDLAQRWQSVDAALVKSASEAPENRSPAAEAELRGRLIQLDARLDALDARIAREFPQYAELVQPQPLELDAAQALLGPDEALLAYLADDDATWLWTLRRDRAALHRIAIGAKALAAEVTALRGSLDPDLNPTLKPFDAARAYALHQRIVAPATDLLDGARQVFVVPDGALESLPTGVLVTDPPQADPEQPGDHRMVSWLARKHAITVLPSVSSLRALRRFTSGARASAPFAGIGNPLLQGRPGATRGVKLASLFRGSIADVRAVRDLTPLPETAEELRLVARSLGAGESDLWLAERASEPLLRRAGLERYRVLSFATHGLTSGDLKGLAEPALVLTPPDEGTPDDDGLLTASEVAQLELNADWVVLSACNTAAGDGTPDAGGLSGLAKAFFYAGARSLLVSHWSVPSRATVKLITGAFDALERDPSIGRAEAMRRAQLAMMDDASLPPEFAHPLAWAAFVLVGEGGAGR